MIVSHLLLILHKKIQFYIFMFEAWNVAKGCKVQGGRILSQCTVLYTTACTVHSESIQTALLFPHFVTLQPYCKIYTQYLIMTKQKQVVRHFCKCIKNKNRYLIYITLCYEIRNWAQVHPLVIDHPWDLSATWLESTSGNFNWLDMIWKGTHLSI